MLNCFSRQLRDSSGSKPGDSSSHPLLPSLTWVGRVGSRGRVFGGPAATCPRRDWNRKRRRSLAAVSRLRRADRENLRPIAAPGGVAGRFLVAQKRRARINARRGRDAGADHRGRGEPRKDEPSIGKLYCLRNARKGSTARSRIESAGGASSGRFLVEERANSWI
jgi:hypothetical protein